MAATARPTHKVDFPVPPFWQAKVIARTTFSRLGTIYREGQGVAQDYVKAREWYENAAAKGDVYAMADLGVIHDNGLGVAQDNAKAREWYEKAAAKGNAFAMNNLGVLYGKGKGVTQDNAKAREWYEKAAAQGERGRRGLPALRCP